MLPSVGIWLAIGLLGASLASRPVHGQRGAGLSGAVTSAERGGPVTGAAITLFPAGGEYALTGTASDAVGRYRLQGIAPGRYRVIVRAPGYHPMQRRIRLDGGHSETLDIALRSATSGEEAVVTTPAHRLDTVRHASAPVSVVDNAALHRSATLAPLDGLRAVPGIYLVQTGLGQRRLSVAGARGGSLRGPLVLVDGRRAGGPASGGTVASLLPTPAIDLQRVAVVQGGAATVHGPSAQAGVIHAITKTPFGAPGTAIAVASGAPLFAQGQFRHAAVIGSTFGYEVVTYGAHGTNWPLQRSGTNDLASRVGDPMFDPPDARLPNQRTDPATGHLRRNDSYWTAGIHGEAVYRLESATTVTARGGYAALTGPLYPTWGPVQADPLGHAFAQLLLEAGELHAQLGLHTTQTSASYRYGTGQAITNRDVAYDARLRYRFDNPYWATAFTVGADGHWARPRTGRSLMGRYEERDAIDRYGMFGAARTALSSWLALSYAARADVDNQSAAVWPGVHIAALIDVRPKHTVRVHYERSASGPEAPALFLDADVYRQSLGGGYRLRYRARGAVDGFSFSRYRQSGQAASLIPGETSFGQPRALSSIPLRPVYDAALAQLATTWADPAAQPASVQGLSPAQRQQLVAALRELAEAFTPGDRTTGELGLPDGRGGYRSVNGPRDVAPLQRPITQTVSVGYHGAMGDRLEVAAGAYVGTIKNAIRPAMATPLVFVPRVRADLEPVLAPLMTQAAGEPGGPLGSLLGAMGMTPDEAAAFTAQAVGRTHEGTPVGVVAPDQAVAPPGEPGTEQAALLTYRNVDRLYQTGARLEAHMTLRDNLQVHGAFTVRHLHRRGRRTADGALSEQSNAPPFEAHVGTEWTRGAWTMHAAAHYASAHSVRAGWYARPVDAGYPVDVGIRFDAQRYIPGLSAQLTVQNVLNQQHRGRPKAPAIERLAWLRVTYAL